MSSQVTPLAMTVPLEQAASTADTESMPTMRLTFPWSGEYRLVLFITQPQLGWWSLSAPLRARAGYGRVTTRRDTAIPGLRCGTIQSESGRPGLPTVDANFLANWVYDQGTISGAAKGPF